MIKTFKTIDPFTSQQIQSYQYMSDAAVGAVIEQLYKGYLQWKTQDLYYRTSALRSLKNKIEDNKRLIAGQITLEMGKPIAQSLAEVDKCLGLIDYCVGESLSLLKPEKRKGYSVSHEPLGVIYGIMPWNFPLWQTLRFALPTLLAGNTVLLKPAETTAGTALLLQKCFDEAFTMKNVFTTVFMDHQQSDRVISHRSVRGVSLTGSTRAGQAVGQVAGRYLKKSVLELGGNDAYLICSDADLDYAVEKVYFARTLNSGQSCISAKRIFVPQKDEAVFLKKLTDKIKAISYGSPSEESSVIGPLARRDLQETLHQQVEQLIREGAVLYYQHQVDDSYKHSCFFPVTVLHQFSAQSSVHHQELFGPVFSVVAYADEDEALELINQSPFGLGGAVFSSDIHKAHRLAHLMETGTVAVNDFFRSTYDKPFGGIKDSGLGKELGPEGFLEFTSLKVILEAP